MSKLFKLTDLFFTFWTASTRLSRGISYGARRDLVLSPFKWCCPAFVQLVSRLCETKCPEKGIMSVAPYKRRGSSARSVGLA
jgi:hypothetical protein